MSDKKGVNIFAIIGMVPLLLIVLIIYNILITFPGDMAYSPEAAPATEMTSTETTTETTTEATEETAKKTPTLEAQLLKIKLASGALWVLTLGDLLIIFGLFILFIEIFKSTSTGSATVVEHSLSTIVFIIYVVEFVLVKEAGTTVFFILGMMSLIDVIAGFSITIATARRDFGMHGMHHPE